MDKLQSVNMGNSVLSTRICRASFGILCAEKYDKKIHGKEKPPKGMDGVRRVKNQVDWIISKVRYLSIY
jgi:hypothetical protein